MAIHEKLSKVMVGLNKIDPSLMEFGRTKYTYLSENAITPAVKELFETNGLVMIPAGIEQNSLIVDDSILATVTIKYEIVEIETKEYVTAYGIGQGMDKGDKAIPKACTAALKQMFRHLLLIASPDRLDPDTTASEALRQQRTTTGGNTPPNRPNTPPSGGGEASTAILQFGPHKGQSLQWLYENDIDAFKKIAEGKSKFADIAQALLKG